MYKKEENGWTQLGGLMKAKHAHKKKTKKARQGTRAVGGDGTQMCRYKKARCIRGAQTAWAGGLQ